MTKSSSPILGGVFRCPHARRAIFTVLSLAVAAIAYTRYVRSASASDDDDGDNNNSAERTERSRTGIGGRRPRYRVVFVLGGPGSGKGTQCERVTKDRPRWVHLSAGDLLRAERKKTDSELATLINDRIKAGQLVPSEITVRLIKNAMEEESQREGGATDFVIDGFPRNVGNVTAWEDNVGEEEATVEFVLYLDCPEEVMTSRLLERGKSSGRSDDNLDTIRKRFETSRKESMPIVDMYEKRGKLREVKADRSVDAVYADVSKLFEVL